MIDITCKMTNKPMAIGIPKTIRKITDSSQESNLIINYQQNIKEEHPIQ